MEEVCAATEEEAAVAVFAFAEVAEVADSSAGLPEQAEELGRTAVAVGGLVA